MPPYRQESMSKQLLRLAGFLAVAWVVIVLAHFPWGVDGPHTPSKLIDDAEDFYEAAYQPPPAGATENEYVEVARNVAHRADVKPRLESFLADHGLQNAKSLEIGAGSGTLQDVVPDYTGLDIASSAGRFFHKPFVHGSATDLPFEDGSFDLAFSIWTYEHVPNPGRAFAEARRVVRDGGWLYLEPAWNNPTWAPNGWPVRHDSTLGPLEMAMKYSLLIREISYFKQAYQYPARAIRTLAAMGGETTLHFREVDANFDNYWMPDSDAVNSIDCYEAALWFQTRGDDVTMRGDPPSLRMPCGDGAVLVQVHKQK
ncbi:MAG: methyltransferase domain-containing protein [Acidobacteria bacterium]|nr:methyltransferase domain-containing protein [Acidobacteriota bacterium]